MIKFTSKITHNMLRIIQTLFVLTTLYACNDADRTVLAEQPNKIINEDFYNVGFLIMDGVYNTELTAPFDIFQHTKFRKGIKAMNTFLIAKTMEPVTSFEGIALLPDFSYQSSGFPSIDILVVPSAEHHLDSDLEDADMIQFVKSVAEDASFVSSHCDGAFVLAKAGLLNDYKSTTFPSDINLYRKMFPQIDVVEDVLFVHDGKFITSAGGAKSFEASLYLAELLYGEDIAKSLAGGLVIDWNLADLDFVAPPMDR